MVLDGGVAGTLAQSTAVPPPGEVRAQLLPEATLHPSMLEGSPKGGSEMYCFYSPRSSGLAFQGFPKPPHRAGPRLSIPYSQTEDLWDRLEGRQTSPTTKGLRPELGHPVGHKIGERSQINLPKGQVGKEEIWGLSVPFKPWGRFSPQHKVPSGQ